MQNDSIDSLRIDINNMKIRGCFYVRQGDTRARTIHITLANNSKVVELGGVVIAELLIKKPDGAENDQNMVVYGNELQYTFRTQDVNVIGECKCQIMLTYDDGTVITSPEFSLFVYSKVVSQDLEKSTNEYTAITNQLVSVNQLAKETKKDADRAENAKANMESYEYACRQYKDEAYNYSTVATSAATSAVSASSTAVSAKDTVLASKDEAIALWDEVEEKEESILAAGSQAEEYAGLAEDYKDEADSYATSAAISDASASAQADKAVLYANKSESYAVGNGTRTGDSADNAKYYYEQAKQISEGLAGALLPMGTITFEQLASVTKSAGYEWNISNDFVSDSRFNDGGGIQYAAGTNVYVTSDLKFDCLTGSTVTGVKGSAETTYRKGYVSILPDDIGLGNVDNTSDLNKPISTATQTAIDGLITRIEALETKIAYMGYPYNP